MKKNKIKDCLLLFAIILILSSSSCFASTDQFKAFKTNDYEIPEVSTTDHNAVNTAVNYGVATFKKLGYINANGSGYVQTSSKTTVLNWINLKGKNYGFYIYAHGNSSCFTTVRNNTSYYIYPSDISGNWHLVFLDSCSCLQTNAFATKFHTDGYSKRATLGWYKTIKHVNSADWWGKFYQEVGSTNIRSACLSAADQCSGSTPIRIYGDKTWNGKAW